MKDAEPAARPQEPIDSEPDLGQKLQQIESLGRAVEPASAAANRHEISMDGGEPASMPQIAGSKMANGELTEEQLSGVDGGILKQQYHSNTNIVITDFREKIKF